MMKRFFTSISVWLLLSLPLFAAEDEASSDQNDQESQATQNTDAEEQTGGVEGLPDIGLIEEERIEQEDDENFIPSVRITEDLPVAFPVDI